MPDDATDRPSAAATPPSETPARPEKDGPDHVAEDATAPTNSADIPEEERSAEIGGQKGPEPTRYGDWERNGRCTDF